jgi:NADP-dependent 3-hydroxy acid dehydrogenase YdfG
MPCIFGLVANYIERARLHFLNNSVHASAVALFGLTAGHIWWEANRSLKVNPSECVIVITGCDSGFGLMTCKHLSSMGFLVVAACLTSAGATALENETAMALQCDVTKEEDVKMLAKKAEELANDKGARVWALVNNAGIAAAGGIDWVSSATNRKVFEVNYFALYEVSRAFIPILKTTKNSRIINISSIAGISGVYNMGPYCGKVLKIKHFPHLIVLKIK